MAKPTFSEEDLAQWATESSIERGWEYYDMGAVDSLVRQGDELLADVWSSGVEPYRVRIRLDPQGVPVDATCTCPYDWGGWCKHIVAVLLTYLHEPERVRERPPLEERLADLSEEELRSLVLYLADKLHAVPDLIEAWMARREEPTFTPGSSSGAPRLSLHPEEYKRKARAIIHSLDHMRRSEAYWHVAEVINNLEDLASRARDFIAAGDVANALNVLIGVTDAYVDDGFILDDSDGYVGEFAYTLGELWASVLLAADLDEDTRETLRQALSFWNNELMEYGVDAPFENTLTAMDLRSPEDVLQTGDPLLIRAYLDGLERSGKDEEYLRFALEAGENGAYAAKLIELGRVEEALAFVRHVAMWGDEWVRVIQALHDAGYVTESLDLAERVLQSSEGKDANFPSHWWTWLADQAEAAGRKDLAKQAAVRAFRLSPSLTLYRRVSDLAGEEWPRLREELLDFLRQHPAAGVGIFLEERLWDDALRAVEQGLVGYDTMRRVVDAVLPHRPEAAARIARGQAEIIMEEGRSKAYHHAVDWLRRVKDAYKIMGKETEWRAYLEGLIERHRKKYKLRPMLEELRD